MTAVTRYDIEVRPGRNSEHFTYYIETVTANNSHDAVAKVQRMNPGCEVYCTKQYTEDEYQKENGGSNTNSYSSGSMQLPSLKSLLVGGVVLYGLSLFGGNVTQLKEMVPNTQQMEYQQPNNNVIQFSEHHIDESIPEFFNTELQEEPVNDLGQDWDN